MPIVPFDQLPEHARLWTFAADRPLDATARARLLETADAFLAEWAAHGAPLTAGRELRYDRFLFVAVDEQSAGVSGCSIDALVRQVRALERELEVVMTDHAPVWYRADDGLHHVSRGEFRELAGRGAVDLATVVFDNTIQTVGALRGGKWEVAARDSWHGSLVGR
jgi:hypothetical protein